MATRDPIVVFDVETIPDKDHHEGDDFPKPLFHRVVALSYLKANIVSDGPGSSSFRIELLKSGGEASSSEEYLISGFFRLIEKWKPRLVTFNGRRFDIPVLRYRALKYGVSAPWFAQGESRWENYGYRYDLDWHFDVMDALSDFGASKSSALHEICALLGIPSKIGIDGSQVQSYFEQGRIEEIRNYCECDVLGTYLVFLRFAHFRGELDDAGYAQSLAAVQSYLTSAVADRPYLNPFIKQA